MKKNICHCGKEMEFESDFIPGIEEHEDYFKCPDGHKIGYYEAIDGET